MKYLIIVAGGQGLRMGGPLPKQFMLLNGRPVIMHTIERFVEAIADIQVVLVLNPDYVELWSELCAKYSFTHPCTIALGGKERFHSVKNGLDKIEHMSCDDVVGVHDAVRPLVSVEVIRNAYEIARKQNAVVPVMPSIESVRMLDDEGNSKAVARNKVMMVQTPQVFTLSLLKEAYSQPYDPTFTDDASVVEALGHSIALVEGNRENVKLTTPQDMRLAEMLMAEGKN